MSSMFWRILVFLLLLSPTFCVAQWVSLPFERITIEDGLPNPSVLDIIQDRQGFMWFGTLNGIVRYDGHQMKVYYPAAEARNSLPERDVPRLYQDKAGNIWVGMANQKAKLFRYDPRVDQFVPYLFNPALPAKKQAIPGAISTISEDNQGRLLVGVWDLGLWSIDVQKENEGVSPADLPFKHYQHKPGDPHALAKGDIFRTLAPDAEGNVWIPTESGLCKFDPEKERFTTYPVSSDSATDNTNCCMTVFYQAPHTLWVGTETQGLVRFDTKAGQIVRKYQHQAGDPFSIPHNRVNAIARDKDGKLWLGAGAECAVFDPATGKFEQVKDQHQAEYGGNFPNTNALICDYSGNIWIATWQLGIYKFNPDKGRFHFVRPGFYTQGNPNKYAFNAVAEDQNGFLWLGTEGDGLIRWNRKNNSFRQYRSHPGNPNSLSNNSISNIVAAADGYLWIGTLTGVDRLDPATGKVRRYQPYPGVGGLAFEAKKGDLWITAWDKGLCHLLDKTSGACECYPERLADQPAGYPGFGSALVLKGDESGNIYVGINQLGFWVIDPATEHFEHFLEEYGVHDIHFDRHGQCWLATHSGGLKLWDRQHKRLIHLPRAEHDKIGIARSILEDGNGFLWMKTPTGVVEFDPVKKRVAHQYSARNWLNVNEYWYGRYTFRSLVSKHGEMFFTAPAGLLYFHPDSVRTDTFPPKIAFTGLRVLDKIMRPGKDSILSQDITYTTGIRLAHWQNDFGIEFAALHFKAPAENRYAWFLENHDHAWRDAGTQRTATYTSIDPGHYIFRVKAISGDGVEGASIALDIIILPPWWATWWAYLIYFLTAGGLLIAIRNYELKRRLAQVEKQRLEELDAVKTRLYTNITHEFRTPLTIILGLAEQLKAQAGEGMKPGLDMIRRNGRQVLRLVNQLLDLAKVESGHLRLDLVQGDIVNYLQYLLESFQSLAAGKKIRLHFQSGLESLLMDYDSDRLQTVVSNLLSNAIKFTPEGGEVWLDLEQVVGNRGQILQLTVRDSGPGIPAEKLSRIFERFYQADDSPTRAAEGTGIGLTLTRELVKLMGGSIVAGNLPNVGAAFTVRLPIAHTAPTPANTPSGADSGWIDQPAATPIPAFLPKAKTPATSDSKPLILLVEDNPDVVQYLHACLNGLYRIEVAYDGEQGIAKALEQVPDLIVSDVMMPHKDGFELCHTLKTDERTSHIPIILLTARADIESRLTGLRRGADAYLAKPFHQEELLVRIQKLLELRRNLQAYYLGLAERKDGVDGTETTHPIPDDALEQAFIQKVRALIEEDFSVQWAVPELARRLHVSISQLHRKLGALTGMHTTEYVRYVRLSKARQLLREQRDEKVSAIAFDVGFSNAQEFSRRFKEAFGVTPADWRRMG